MRLLRVPGVYRPGSDSRLLAAEVAIRVRPTDRVLDVFSGSGVQAITAAMAGAREVWAIDVARRASLSIALNARLNGVRVRASRGDLFEPVRGERFDLIVANPPFVPSGRGDGPVRGAARAWEAGFDGRLFLDPFLHGLPNHIAAGGRVLLVQSSTSDVPLTVAALTSAGLDAEVLRARREPLGPITSRRADALEGRGLLGEQQRTEEMVVIGATARIAAPTPPLVPVAALSPS